MEPRLQFVLDVLVLLVVFDDSEVIKADRAVVVARDQGPGEYEEPLRRARRGVAIGAWDPVGQFLRHHDGCENVKGGRRDVRARQTEHQSVVHRGQSIVCAQDVCNQQGRGDDGYGACRADDERAIPVCLTT